MARYYRLDGHTVVPSDLIGWGNQFEDRYSDGADPWRVARTDLDDGTFVSTVFLGFDYNHRCCDHACSCPGGVHVPLLFETMVFSDEDEYQERCSTWDQAVVQHADVVARYRGKAKASSPGPVGGGPSTGPGSVRSGC